ncbi:hypothetical protein B0H65DRAFT_473292 [Neurospora tetraspora]|uniref:Uncharacterized protein n=1 Tax=Neurospora tetraspora TaxID=94610 RepID=A0AAE0MPL3_9PEZI|nr:hypothetical protein B0H65DRAFT_473292 [Neurospora tetraspora]
MAPVALESEPRYLPLVLAGSHITASLYLTYIIGLGLYRSYAQLGPAQDTRGRISQRQKLAATFGSLSLLSLGSAIKSGLEYLTLSYKVWASERGIPLQQTLSGGFSLENLTPEHVRAWLNDTPLYLDALEIVAEKARRLWWGQQLDLATVSWTMLLAVEGRRRNIPFLWAYALLAHLVNLSFAQNLLYVAMLLTPAPIDNTHKSRLSKLLARAFPPKPTNWFPKPAFFHILLVLNYLVMLWVPRTAGTVNFPTAVAISKALSLAPLVLPAIIPKSWGTIHTEPHDTYSSLTKLFNVMSVASLLLHCKTSIAGLWYNLPGSYKHRHSVRIPFDIEKRSAWERSTTAMEKILGSMTDHPAVAAAGKDVLLCAFSLGIWAAVRALDVDHMLKSVAPFYGKKDAKKALPPSYPNVAKMGITEPEPISESEPSRPSSSSSLTMKLRDRGKHVSSKLAEALTANGNAETSPNQAPRRRGRPRKIKQEPTPEPELGTINEVAGVPDAAADSTYEPTPAVRAQAVEGDVLPDDEFDWESAALAWGLTALGGLGVGSSAVYGAECVSR